MAIARTDPKDLKAYQIDLRVNGVGPQKTVRTVAEGMALLRATPGFTRLPDLPWLMGSLCSEYLTARTAEGSRGLVRLQGRLGYIEKAFGDRKACALTSDDLFAFAKVMTDQFGYGSACKAVQLLGSVYREAVARGVLTEDPSIDVCASHKSAKPGPLTEVITDLEEMRILQACSDISEMLLAHLALDGGLVQSELPALKYKDFGKRSVTVSRSISDKGQLVDALEHRNRQVPLSPLVIAAVTDLRSGKSDDDLVFPGPKGGMLSVGAVTARAQQLMFRAGIEPGTVNQRKNGKARFTLAHLTVRAAVKWIRDGVSPPIVSRRLGYATYQAFARKFEPYVKNAPAGKPAVAIDRIIWPNGRQPALTMTMPGCRPTRENPMNWVPPASPAGGTRQNPSH